MPPKERNKYDICFFKKDGTLIVLNVDVSDVEISSDTEEILFNLPWFGYFNDSMASFTFNLKRKPSVEIFFPKKHRHNASIARRRRRYHGRTENVCQNNNRQ